MTTATFINRSSGPTAASFKSRALSERAERRAAIINKWNATSNTPVLVFNFKLHEPMGDAIRDLSIVIGRLNAQVSETELVAGADTFDHVGESETSAVSELDLVLQALNDPKWDFRTVDGICRSTGLAREVVVDVVSSNPASVRPSLVPSPDGRTLYTSADKSVTIRERLALARLMLTKSLN